MKDQIRFQKPSIKRIAASFLETTVKTNLNIYPKTFYDVKKPNSLYFLIRVETQAKQLVYSNFYVLFEKFFQKTKEFSIIFPDENKKKAIGVALPCSLYFKFKNWFENEYQSYENDNQEIT